MKVVMYSKGGCGYCEMASKWFEEHAVRYTEVKMDDEEESSCVLSND